MPSREQERLKEKTDASVRPWRKWGPYVRDRAWGTVREDYSADGDAWAYFPHDLARSKAYRWGEDGIAGICDRYQLLCFALAFWNGRDPILKERLFGCVASEGNHGEDVKEYYFYLDATPTHSYMKFLYKYPQAPYPYEQADRGEPPRGRRRPEFELLDTGIFDDDRYFDIVHRVREGRTRRPLHPHRGVQPRAGGRAAAHPAAPLVPQHLGLGSARRGAEPSITLGPDGAGFLSLVADRRGARAGGSPSITASAHATSTPPAADGPSSPTTRRTARASGALQQPQALTSRTRSIATSSTASTQRQPRADRDEGRRSLSPS